MHIAHIQGIFSPEHGGPTQSLANYAQGQVANGHRVSVWVLEGFPGISPAVRLEPPVEMRVFTVGMPARLGRSPVMRHQLREADSPDVYHLHGAWLRAMHYGAVEAKRRGKPYVLEVMGMYEPWGLHQKRLQKQIARVWFQDEILHNADCLHVSSAQEAENLRALGFKAPLAVIPVGVNLEVIETAQKEASAVAPWKELEGRPFVLFLSRIHEKKGIELLLRAWERVQKTETKGHSADWRLVIAGTGEVNYVRHCKSMAEQLGLKDCCLWAGRLTEREKTWAYSNAGLFVLPSYSENYGNAVAEALAHGTPVISTTETPWKTLHERQCGWTIHPNVEELVTALNEALELGFNQLRSMGQNGVEWCRKEFALDLVIRDLENVYQYVQGGPKPPCVL